MSLFDDLILAGRESTSLEYKRSAPWEDLRLALIRTVLGMANTRSGGHIVVGMVENEDGTCSPQGVTSQDRESFPPEEEFQAAVNGFAEPFIEPRVQRHEPEGKRFLVITVPEFDYEPVLCMKKEGSRLQQGRLYVRSTRKPETVEVRTPTDMRALMRLATEKAVGLEVQKLRALGLLPAEPRESDTNSEAFAKQLEDV